MDSIVIALAVGLLVGLSMGALGGGGAIIAIPALIYLLDTPPAQATTASLAIVALASVSGIASHARSRNVAWLDGVTFGLLAIGGSYAGARLSARVDPDWLLVAFAMLLVVVAALMWRKSMSRGSANSGAARRPWLQLDPLRLDWSRLLPVLATATGVGLLTGFFGVGGGFAIVPALVLALGMSMRRAVGTSLLVILVVSLESLGLKLVNGIRLEWDVVLAFAGTAVLASVVGAKLSTKVPGYVLQRVFAGLLLAIAVYTAASSLPHVM